jgi:hypothetical protein
MYMHSRSVGSVFAAILVALASTVVMMCASTPAQAPGAPLPGTSVTPERLTDLEPHAPYRQLVPGLLVRTRYAADTGAQSAVEIWDLMVGPGMTTENARLAGAAIIEVRSGIGVLTALGSPHELRIGTTFALDEGAEFVIKNGDKDVPLILRVTLIQSVRP